MAQSLNLIISCFVTHKRNKIQKSRIKQFLATLYSYSRIKWNNVYLFIKLDDDIAHYQNEVEYLVKSSFDFQTLEIKFDRIMDKKDWQLFFLDKMKSNQLWWFTQNDDHAYLNSNSDYLNNLLNVLSEKIEPSSIYLSHWPEILRVASNQNDCFIGEYCIEFKGLLFDSIQIFNQRMIKYVFFEIGWPCDNMARIDTIAISDNIIKNGLSATSHRQLILVPLRELCRKFIGYDHVRLDFPAELRYFNATWPVVYENEDLLEYVTASHISEWGKKNPNKIRAEILDLILLNNHKKYKIIGQSFRFSKFKFPVYLLNENIFYFRNVVIVLKLTFKISIGYLKDVVKFIVRKK